MGLLYHWDVCIIVYVMFVLLFSMCEIEAFIGYYVIENYTKIETRFIGSLLN